MHPQDFIFIFHGFLLFLVYGSSASHQRRGLGAGVSQVADFDCPEEFGYYPHPTDCTQYYVCVFGGALLESCTGGLMYSHELQTCDWPRNVGCSESGGSDGGTISTVRVTDPRTRAPQNSRTSSTPQQPIAQQSQSSRNRQQEYNRVRQPEVIQQQLYAEEDLGPAEEIENDRQQRVYRGQPSTIGQVQRDRDGLRPLKNSVHSQNVIPTGSGNQDKISVVSFGSQRASAPRPQEQYSDFLTLMDSGLANITDIMDNDVDMSKHSRRKRQIPYRVASYPVKPAKIPITLIPSANNPEQDPKNVRNSNPTYNAFLKSVFRNPANTPTSYSSQNNNKFQIYHDINHFNRHNPGVIAIPNRQNHQNHPQSHSHTSQIHNHPIHYHQQSFGHVQNTNKYQPQNVEQPSSSQFGQSNQKPQNVDIYRGQLKKPLFTKNSAEELTKLTKSTIQTEFRPMRPVVNIEQIHTGQQSYEPNTQKPKYLESIINPVRTTPQYFGKTVTDSYEEVTKAPQKVKITNTYRKPQTEKPKQYYVEITKENIREHYFGPEETIKLSASTDRINPFKNYYRTTETPVIKPEIHEVKYHRFKPMLTVTESSVQSTQHQSVQLEPERIPIRLPERTTERTQEIPHKNRYRESTRVQTSTESILDKYSRYRETADTTAPPKKLYASHYTTTNRPVISKTTKQPETNIYRYIDRPKDYDYGNNDYVEPVRNTTKYLQQKPKKQYNNVKDYDYDYEDKEIFTKNKEYDQKYEKPESDLPDFKNEEYTLPPTQKPRSKLKYKSKETNSKENYDQRVKEPNHNTQKPYKNTQNYNNEYETQNEYSKDVVRTKDYYNIEDYPKTQNKLPEYPLKTSRLNISFFDYLEQLGFKDIEGFRETLNVHTLKNEVDDYETTTLKNIDMNMNDQQFYVPDDKVNVKRPLRYRTTTERPAPNNNQIESPRKKIPEEYYENFKPFPSQSLTEQRPKLRRPTMTSMTDEDTVRVEQVQNYQVTSALPPLSQSQRTVERYNTSQRYQQNQYDPYYAVYDDSDLYRQNDYSQQQYQTPSSTPSSNIVQQYRGQATYKQQNVEIEQQEEPQQQQHRNVYNQDLYSPSPVLQDYNDQFNVQIDDQQYQQIAQPTPKAPSRSETSNTSKDALPESSIVNSRITNNTTPKTDSAPITRRSDNYNPSSILVPPPKQPQQNQRDLDTSLTPPKNEKAYYIESFPQFRSNFPVVSNRNNLVPPRNGGTLAKSLNNFDSILANFFTAVTSGNERLNEKPAPETIVRSEIGRIQHEPIIISDDYKKPKLDKGESKESDDYLAYFVEIEPKKPKEKEPTRGFLLTKPENESSEKRIITKETLQDGDNDEVGFNVRGRNRQINNFVRVSPNKEENRNIKLSTAIDIEPIEKPKGKPVDESENETVEVEKDSSEDVQPLPLYDHSSELRGRAKTRPRPQVVREEHYEANSQERSQRIRNRRPEHESSEELKIIKNPNPYKFVVVNLEQTTEKHLSTPAPFSRNPENEERNYQEKTRTEEKFNSRYVSERFEERTTSTIPIRVEDASGVYLPKNIEIEPTTKKSVRIRTTTTTEPTSTTHEPEEHKKPRRIIKIHRSDLRNQRLNLPKVKRIRKPSTQLPTEDLEDKSFTKENEIHSTFRPIIVHDDLETKNKSRFRFTIEDAKDFTLLPDGKLGLFVSTTEPYETNIDTVPRGFEKANVRPAFVPIDPERSTTEAINTDKPLILIPTRTQTYRNNTEHENRATVKPYRGKFKPTESSKIRLRPTTASPDSETTPGPHLPTRQPSNSYNIGNSGNEVNSNRGTPATSRGTRPTLKPSTQILSKASEFVDIYRYPPSRPQNLYATPTPDKSAAKCRKDVCLLPDCYCGGKDIPGGYSAEEIPQLVLLTFDDSVNDLNKGLYSELFERGRVNPNGCPISATFYVSHEWTDYSQVQNLYANGHEIASHSITHSFGEQFSQKKWTKEIAGQREILSAYGGVRLEDIRGMRAPFLAVGGNKMFKMLYDSNFTYDSSMPIYENRPPSWPYTLDYKLFHDCMIPPCPTKSYPGVWEVPMVMWQDLNGGRCSMGDACSNPPTADGVYKMLIKNFERHFTTNRAPFGLYYHAAWFTHEHHKEGFIAFLDTIVNMPEVWLVTSWQAIQWVRDPQPLSTVENFPPFQCNEQKAKRCNNPKVCNLWHKSGVRYMRTCQPCPEVYPWTGKTGVRNSRVDNEIIDE